MEISKLKVELNKNERKEFEAEDRIKWIESKEEILNKFIKDLESKNRKNLLEDVEDNILEAIVDNSSECQESESLNTPPPTTLKDILPPKPETKNTLLSLPKSKSKESTSSSSSPKSTNETLVFSEEIQSKHDDLTNELIATVQLIKRNNLHIQKIVKSDEKIITEATGLLATNSDSMQKESKNLKSYSKKAWVSFWKMILILLFTCMAFIFVYIFIRLT